MKRFELKKYRLQIAYVGLLSACLPLLFVWLGLIILLLNHFEKVHSGLMLFAVGFPVFFYWSVVVILGIGNAVHSFRIFRENQEVEYVNSMLILKYGLVVFFCVNFILLVFWYFMFALGMFIGSRGTILFALPVLLPWLIICIGLAVIGTWLAILPGSCYSLQVLRQAYKQGKLSRSAMFLHAVLQFIFLIDVLDAMYLALKLYGRGKRSSIVVSVLYLLVLIGIVILFMAVMK